MEDRDIETSDINDVEDTTGNAGTDAVADKETEGSGAVLGSRASSAATESKKYLLSLVRDPCSNFGSETETYEAKDIICIQQPPLLARSLRTYGSNSDPRKIGTAPCLSVSTNRC